ncbi:a41e7ea4-83ac-4b85-95c7-d1445a7f9d48 [Thermothielavioides terrestris]|uniref:A41e7ea4-83ac-4b85-95c7-d1445a7f9d48 n=1 Tax=Thermothielavioides terrestris TaxID=2587410 RepID=A0A446B7S8_9PEZI|nr:a41e7ea4-83ac-4b85-95c7-d1445a7f9d48 [Thermothielavioides terrestris]
MGIIDDAASIISARTSHSKRSKSHRSSHSRHHTQERSKSRSRSRERHRSSRSAAGVGGGISGIAASIFGGGDDDHDDHDRRRSHHHDRDDGTRSFFSLPNASRSSFFSAFGRPSHQHRPASRPRPRSGLLPRLLKKLRRLLRDLVYYAKRHPAKVFMLVLMPLITGGALTALLARFGLRLPPFLERMLGVAARAAGAGAGAGGSLGLVGEAVRLVSSGGGGGAGAAATRASVERGRHGGMQWERRSVGRDYDGEGAGAEL